MKTERLLNAIRQDDWEWELDTTPDGTPVMFTLWRRNKDETRTLLADLGRHPQTGKMECGYKATALSFPSTFHKVHAMIEIAKAFFKNRKVKK